MVEKVLAEEKGRRQKELEKYIFNLSEKLLEDDTEKREIVLKLTELYNSDFRHNYSGFFPIIMKIFQEDNEYNIEFLSNNLETLRSFVEADFISGIKEFEVLYSHFEKLCDHLNLEIARWSYYSQNEQKIKDMETISNTLKENMMNAEQELRAASKQASSIQTELIAVLSIFAAIVVTFSGGFTFLGSVMTSVNGAKYYEAVALAAIICGMVIFNTIFLLMYMVGKITDRNIYASCKTKDCSCDPKCGNLKKIRKRLPYVFYFNLLCIIGIIADCLIWYFNMKGCLGI